MPALGRHGDHPTCYAKRAVGVAKERRPQKSCIRQKRCERLCVWEAIQSIVRPRSRFRPRDMPSYSPNKDGARTLCDAALSKKCSPLSRSKRTLYQKQGLHGRFGLPVTAAVTAFFYFPPAHPNGPPPDVSHFLLRVECASYGPQGPSPPCPADPLRNAVNSAARGGRQSQFNGYKPSL